MRLSVATGACGLCLCLASPAVADTVAAPNQDDLSNLSIEQLANIQVRSASKREEPLSAAPAALYVIDHEQIELACAHFAADALDSLGIFRSGECSNTC